MLEKLVWRDAGVVNAKDIVSRVVERLVVPSPALEILEEV